MAKATRTIKRKVKVQYVSKCRNCGKFSKGKRK